MHTAIRSRSKCSGMVVAILSKRPKRTESREDNRKRPPAAARGFSFGKNLDCASCALTIKHYAVVLQSKRGVNDRQAGKPYRGGRQADQRGHVARPNARNSKRDAGKTEGRGRRRHRGPAAGEYLARFDRPRSSCYVLEYGGFRCRICCPRPWGRDTVAAPF